MGKHFNLYYLFLEEKEKSKLTKEETTEIWKSIEQLFTTLKRKLAVLPEEKKEG